MTDAAAATAQNDDETTAAAWWTPWLCLVLFVVIGWWVYDKVRHPGLVYTGGSYADGSAAVDHGADGHGSSDSHGASDSAADHSAASTLALAEDMVNDGVPGRVSVENEVPPGYLEAPQAVADDATNIVGSATEAAGGIVLDFQRQVGDIVLTGAAGGVEDRLIAFIESGREPCTAAGCWFSFDRLSFRTGSAELDESRSSQQIANIVAIMNAYPNVELKFGGYTDNTGNEAFNYDLSDRRAKAVVQALVDRGIAASRLGAEGYGPEFPIASNDTSAGRAQNRRVDVRVRAR